jgi:hypothetical protein
MLPTMSRMNPPARESRCDGVRDAVDEPRAEARRVRRRGAAAAVRKGRREAALRHAEALAVGADADGACRRPRRVAVGEEWGRERRQAWRCGGDEQSDPALGLPVVPGVELERLHLVAYCDQRADSLGKTPSRVTEATFSNIE